MPNKGISMNKIKQILRLSHESQLSQRQIAKSLGVSCGVVNKYIQTAMAKGLTWPLSEKFLDDEYLRCFLSIEEEKPQPRVLHNIDFHKINSELKRKGVTLQLLWEEAKEANSNIVSYSQYCLLYRKWKKTQPRSMRQDHKAGDKVFIDYAGPTINIIDRSTGEAYKAQIFVGVLGASNYTYAEATLSQKMQDWLGAQKRMFEFFGGVPALVVLDNLRSGVSKACYYEPDTNPTYADFIEYYNTAVLPTRPVKPKDKAKVEVGVLIVERWILARLRNKTFFSLAELNTAIRDLLIILNNKPFKKKPGTRASAFKDIDKPALKSLPKYPYEYATIKKATVAPDYHIELDRHYYSVPYQFIGQEIIVRYTNTSIECWRNNVKLATHVRSYQQGRHTTITEHMPSSHRIYKGWTPGRFLNWASSIGQPTLQLVKHLLENKPHPEQGYRSCFGLLGLAKKYGGKRLNQACTYAWQSSAKTRRSVASILEHNLDLMPPNNASSSTIIVTHENIRGQNHYQ